MLVENDNLLIQEFLFGYYIINEIWKRRHSAADNVTHKLSVAEYMFHIREPFQSLLLNVYINQLMKQLVPLPQLIPFEFNNRFVRMLIVMSINSGTYFRADVWEII